MKGRFLSAEWRKLAIANYAVDPAVLLPYLPYKTELDLWRGKCYVSLVGFMFLNTKLKGIPVPFHRNFEEVNLRFYVKHHDGEGWKRGVCFIREIVPLRALSFVANSFYNEKYITLPMKHRWDLSEKEIAVSYSWKYRTEWNSFSLLADPALRDMPVGSDEEFITEHYWGYNPINIRSSSEYGVQHPRWQTYEVKTYDIEVNFAALYGKDFAFLNSVQPDSVMLAEGSEIAVQSLRELKP